MKVDLELFRNFRWYAPRQELVGSEGVASELYSSPRSETDMPLISSPRSNTTGGQLISSPSSEATEQLLRVEPHNDALDLSLRESSASSLDQKITPNLVIIDDFKNAKSQKKVTVPALF